MLDCETRASSLAPAEVAVEEALVQQALEVLEPRVARPFEVLPRQPDLAIRGRELRRASPRVPFRLVLRERALEAAAVDSVTPRVGDRALRQLDLALRQLLVDERREVADLVVLARGADVERLRVDRLPRRRERTDDGATAVADVDDRPPRAPVGEEPDPAGRERPADEVVQDDVEAKAWRDTVRGRVAERDGGEAGVRELDEALLGADLRLRVGRERLERGVLVERVVAARGAVHAARRGEDEPRDACLPGDPRQVQGALVVHVVGPRGVQVAERVVRERREVDDGVEPSQIGGAHVAEGPPKLLHPPELRAEIAAAVEERVEADDVVARLGDQRRDDRADVAVVAGDDHLHERSSSRTASRSADAAAATTPNGRSARSATS